MDFDAWQKQLVVMLGELVDDPCVASQGKQKFFKDLGLPKAFLRNMRQRLRFERQRLPFDDLFKVFSAAGLQPVVVFYEAGRKIDPTLPALPRLGLATRASQLSREIVDELKAWAAEDSRGPSPQGTTIEEMRGFCTWRRLHRLVLSEPHKVIDDARPALLLAEPRLRTRILAVVGTALRKTGDLAGASHLIEEARQLATVLEDYEAIADAMHRLSRVTLERGEVDEAMEQIREASLLYSLHGDREGVARTLMTQGHYSAHLEDFRQAEASFRSALRELPTSDRDGRFSAFTNLARITYEDGRPHAALRWLRAANANRDGVAEEMVYVSLQTQGAIAFEVDDYRQAVQCFRRCREFYLRAGIPLEAAYNTVWLAHALLEAGRVPEVIALTRESLELVGLLKRNPIAAGVIASLLRQLKAGSIRATELLKYRHQLEELRKGAR